MEALKHGAERTKCNWKRGPYRVKSPSAKARVRTAESFLEHHAASLP